MTNLLVKLFVKNNKDIENIAVRTSYGNLGGITGIICNLILFIIKLLGGLLSGSFSIIADAFEALLAAIYLDSGSKEQVKTFLLPFITAQVSEMENSCFNLDFKTMLQQFVQQSEGDLLEYMTVGEKGPDHMKIFEVEARLNSNVVGRGSGKTKREAEQNAARAALELFGVLEVK